MSIDMGAAEQLRRLEPLAPPVEERDEVRKLLILLDRTAKKMTNQDRGRPCRLVGPLGEEVELPASIFYVLERVAEVMAHGDAVTVVPTGQMLTTQQAANLLNVSRQYLVRLLDEGCIPYEKAGTHRRVNARDILAFKRKRADERKKALDDLVALSEEDGGYPELD